MTNVDIIVMHLTAVLLIALVFLQRFGEQPADIKKIQLSSTVPMEDRGCA